MKRLKSSLRRRISVKWKFEIGSISILVLNSELALSLSLQLQTTKSTRIRTYIGISFQIVHNIKTHILQLPSPVVLVQVRRLQASTSGLLSLNSQALSLQLLTCTQPVSGKVMPFLQGHGDTTCNRQR
ncbi:uncharacterized protein LOC132266757 [Cornus florida]|uniref:uncharacterized protein LOC132266757 n=1 Tax=Cornus florida TaxID=4283 RepID=UPI0028967FF8|nr:uncharacterized protein LOC132266757 [Cornus florida]